jgi:hypothetical protein
LKKTKLPVLKEMKSQIQPTEVRSLILGCVFVTLENNPDLNSYIFNTQTIQMHRLAKYFIESKKLKDESIEHLPEFICPELAYLAQNKVIEEKKESECSEPYKVYKVSKNLFIEIE